MSENLNKSEINENQNNDKNESIPAVMSSVSSSVASTALKPIPFSGHYLKLFSDQKWNKDQKVTEVTNKTTILRIKRDLNEFYSSNMSTIHVVPEEDNICLVHALIESPKSPHLLTDSSISRFNSRPIIP